MSTTRNYRQVVIALLLERDGELCLFCHQILGDKVDIDHIIPLAENGPNVLSNLRLLHIKCHKTRRPPRMSRVPKIELPHKEAVDRLWKDWYPNG
mgnify:CR=1 FL=1